MKYGSKHDIVSHPKYPELRTVLPRHSTLAKAYIREAVDLIDKLERLMAEEESDDE